MKTIHKYTLNVSSTQVALPVGAKILKIGEQGREITLWCLVDPGELTPDKKLAKDVSLQVVSYNIYGTGWEIPNNPGRFIDTCIMDGGRFVWHVFFTAWADLDFGEGAR